MSKKNKKQTYKKYHNFLIAEEKKEQEKKKEKDAKKAAAAEDEDVEMDSEKGRRRLPGVRKCIRKRYHAYIRDIKKAVKRSLKGGEEINVPMKG